MSLIETTSPGVKADWRLGRRPGLDGLRGIAVILVVVGHMFQSGAIDWLSGSGVQMFFVLSGFLITSLLLEQLSGEGRFTLRSFYARRARRLGPALAAMVAIVALLSLFVAGYANWPLMLGTLTWSANWVKISELHHGLRAHAEAGTPLGHTWSLSVEEQFYLVWPVVLLVLVRLGRQALLWVTAIGVAVTAALPLVLHDDVADYYGSHTRAMPLLLGCLLAGWMHRRPEGKTQVVLATVALPWIVVVTWSRPFLPNIDAQVVAVLTAAMVWAVAQGNVRTFLHTGWLRLVGQRSYALYLWHWPVYVLIGYTIGPDPWKLAVIGAPVAWCMALLSWRYVEKPFIKATAEPV